MADSRNDSELSMLEKGLQKKDIPDDTTSKDQNVVSGGQDEESGDKKNTSVDQNDISRDQTEESGHKKEIPEDQNDVSCDQNELSRDQNEISGDKRDVSGDQNSMPGSQKTGPSTLKKLMQEKPIEELPEPEIAPEERGCDWMTLEEEEEKIMNCIREIAAKCTHANPKKRPTSFDVLDMLYAVYEPPKPCFDCNYYLSFLSSGYYEEDEDETSETN